MIFRAIANTRITRRNGSFKVEQGEVCYLREDFAHRRLGAQAPLFDVIAGARQDAATMISHVPREAFTNIEPWSAETA